jgi:hypothetical protein
LERSPRRAIRVDGSVADRDLVGPAPPLRGKHRHHHRPPRTTPRRCDSNDPHPGQEPPHPDRLTIRSEHNDRAADRSANGTGSGQYLRLPQRCRVLGCRD